MAKKSKTQKAKASAARAQRKEQAKLDAAASAESKDTQLSVAEKPKKGLFSKSEKTEKTDSKVSNDKEIEKPKKKRGKIRQFFHDVRLEMKRVTWPSKKEVLNWSIVVVFALLFFGAYVAVLDNLIITPLLVGLTGLVG